MTIIKLPEGLTQNVQSWNASGFDSIIIDDLVAKKILRPSLSGGFSLHFVGLLIYPTTAYLVYPKFEGGDQIGIHLILKILRFYFSRSSIRKPSYDSMRDPEFNSPEALREYDIMIKLYEWFLANGQYKREIVTRSTTGRVDWARTIAKFAPLISSSGVIYSDQVTTRRLSDSNHISIIQTRILRLLLEKYQIQATHLIQPDDDNKHDFLRSWPPEEHELIVLRRLISSERSVVYRTDAIRLLKLLDDALTVSVGRPNQPLVFGTTAFYAVWEDACRVVFGEICDENKELLGQPNWHVPNANGTITTYTHSQIPDFLVKRDKQFFIFDAKYYSPFPSIRPGAPDIIKQIYYAEALNVPPDYGPPRSIFILPGVHDQDIEFLGQASVTQAARSFPTVEAWGVNPLKLIDFYLSTSSSYAEVFFDILLASPTNMGEVFIHSK